MPLYRHGERPQSGGRTLRSGGGCRIPPSRKPGGPFGNGNGRHRIFRSFKKETQSKKEQLRRIRLLITRTLSLCTSVAFGMFVLSGCEKKYSNDAWNLSLADSPELEAYVIARYDFRQSLAGFERYLNRSAPMLPTLIKRPFILPESWELSITTEHFIRVSIYDITQNRAMISLNGPAVPPGTPAGSRFCPKGVGAGRNILKIKCAYDIG